MKRYRKPYFEALLDDKELQKIIHRWDTVFHPRGIRNNLILRILADTGMRLGELRRLERDDINLETREVKIYGQLKHRIRITKISSETAVLLKHFLAIREDECQSLIPTFEVSNGYIVKAWPLTPRSIQRVVANTAKELNIPKLVNPKVFRAMKYIELIRSNTKVDDIARYLGLSATSREYLRYKSLV